MGKEKYGGPFTTEQVEDVKAFLGILSVLLTLGPIMMVDFSVDGLIFRFSSHLDGKFLESILNDRNNIKIDSLAPLLITLLIPLYLYLLRPFFYNYISGMLKRIGIGMILFLLSILCTLVMDAYGHIHANMTICFLSYDPLGYYNFTGYANTTILDINSDFLIPQYFLNALGYMFLYIVVYEFIILCSQSPQRMKELTIGTFFVIKGV